VQLMSSEQVRATWGMWKHKHDGQRLFDRHNFVLDGIGLTTDSRRSLRAISHAFPFASSQAA
jgi:hypothetical protein